MKMYLPVLLVVLSNTVYHICSKSLPANINMFASLTVTYLVAAAASLVIFFIDSRGGNLIAEYKNINWATIVLGLAIIGLEAGFMLMYKMGWSISTGELVAAAGVSIVLVFVGFLMFGEAITLKKVGGVLVILAGLWLVNK